MPATDVYADLAEIAGTEGLLSLARNYLNQGQPVKTLHALEVTLAGDPGNTSALRMRREALEVLMVEAENGLKNDYEIYWLKYRMADTDARLEGESL